MQVWKIEKQFVPSTMQTGIIGLPIMKAYEERRPSYFGTPAVNLIVALETSLKIICKEGMDKRVKDIKV
jgi:alanine-glyoxylate transaminase/serine-glyoxylate transaminase/serine-pyruvate transaminase